LVQYTLAVDRGNASLVTRYTPLHPAVLRLIARTVEVAKAAKLEVSVCGEMASQPLMAYVLLGLGVRTLSVAAGGIPVLKRLVRGVSSAASAKAAQRALAAGTARDAEQVLRLALAQELGDELLDGLLGLA
jgi:phosphoenolpyruvate-protein kinase (PTS system EI component)